MVAEWLMELHFSSKIINVQFFGTLTQRLTAKIIPVFSGMYRDNNIYRYYLIRKLINWFFFHLFPSFACFLVQMKIFFLNGSSRFQAWNVCKSRSSSFFVCYVLTNNFFFFFLSFTLFNSCFGRNKDQSTVVEKMKLIWGENGWIATKKIRETWNLDKIQWKLLTCKF